MALIQEYKGRTYDLSKSWIDMSPEERQVLEDEAAAGEFLRGDLIRFGYVSEEERRRLIATYSDLRERFDRRPSFLDKYKQAGFIFIALIMGIGMGGGASMWHYIIGTTVYWGIALWVLRALEREEQARTECYWEWRGYKCDKYGRKI
jgi:hypothetical protein